MRSGYWDLFYVVYDFLVPSKIEEGGCGVWRFQISFVTFRDRWLRCVQSQDAEGTVVCIMCICSITSTAN